MDNNNLDNGHAALAVSLITGFIAWIGSFDFGDIVKTVSMLVSIGAGIMAIRYYYHATKKHK